MGYELTAEKSEERLMNRFIHVLLVAVGILGLVTLTNADAQGLQDLPTPALPEYDQLTPDNPKDKVAPETLPQAPVYKMNRQVPCTSLQAVIGLLENRGQRPVAKGIAVDPREKFNQLVITYNEATSEFNIIAVTADNVFACNLYSGAVFTRM